MNASKYILLTIDVEDWFQVENLRSWVPVETWGRYALRVEQNTRRLLDLFDGFEEPKVKATFFVLGWVAERIPSLTREIHQRGHEVASHGYGHLMCDQMGIDELKKDLKLSKDLLEDIIGSPVKGYRAPNFSVHDKALEAIENAGYSYDSSFNDFSRHGRYGHISLNGSKRRGVAFELSKGFHEIPISNLKMAGQTLPWGGGGYFRLLPFRLFLSGLRQILKSNGAYIFYLHPWEIDPEQPKVNEAKGSAGWRHYYNLRKTFTKLEKMISHLKDCRFTTCSQYLASHC